MNQEQMKNDLVNEVIYAMYSKIGDENTDALKSCLYMNLMKYNLSEKSTEVTVYKGDETQNLLRKFLIGKKVKGCTDRTLEYYRKSISHVFERIGKSPVETTVDDIRAYMAIRQMQDKVSPVTINNECRALSSFYTYMRQEEIILRNPMEKIDQMKVQKRKKEAFTELELERMRTVCETNRERAMFEILLSTGCRVTELTLIRRDEIDGNQILVHGKGQKDRYVYLNAKAIIALEKYMNERSDESPWIFPCCTESVTAGIKGTKGTLRNMKKCWYQNPELVGDKPQDKGAIESVIRKIGKEVGVKAHPHKFRRTCATFALRNGMPLLQVSKMLGHESVETTQIYLDLNEEELREAHQKYVR